MSYLPLRAHPTTLPLLLAESLDLFVTVLVPVEAEAQYVDLKFRWQFFKRLLFVVLLL